MLPLSSRQTLAWPAFWNWPADGGDCEAVLGQFAAAGIDIDELAAKLQDDGAKSFVSSWNELMGVIASKSAKLTKAA